MQIIQSKFKSEITMNLLGHQVLKKRIIVNNIKNKILKT